jgi:hypothetical protein
MASFGLFHQMVHDIDTRSMQTVFKPGLDTKTSWTDMFQDWSLNDFKINKWTSWISFVHSDRPKMYEKNRQENAGVITNAQRFVDRIGCSSDEEADRSEIHTKSREGKDIADS